MNIYLEVNVKIKERQISIVEEELESAVLSRIRGWRAWKDDAWVATKEEVEEIENKLNVLKKQLDSLLNYKPDTHSHCAPYVGMQTVVKPSIVMHRNPSPYYRLADGFRRMGKSQDLSSYEYMDLCEEPWKRKKTK